MSFAALTAGWHAQLLLLLTQIPALLSVLVEHTPGCNRKRWMKQSQQVVSTSAWGTQMKVIQPINCFSLALQHSKQSNPMSIKDVPGEAAINQLANPHEGVADACCTFPAVRWRRWACPWLLLLLPALLPEQQARRMQVASWATGHGESDATVACASAVNCRVRRSRNTSDRTLAISASLLATDILQSSFSDVPEGEECNFMLQQLSAADLYAWVMHLLQLPQSLGGKAV